MIRTTVIIPTRDAAGPLRACLEALVVGFPSDAETIVVLDGGIVDVEPILGPFMAPLRLRYLRTDGRGPAYARNRGLAEARGAVALFTDDDCRPHAGWAAALTEAVSETPPRAVGGRTVNGVVTNPYSDAAQVVLDLVARHQRSTSGAERFFPCNNCAFPVGPLRSIGGFHEDYRTAEDRELCRRWVDAGFELGLAPNAVVAHDANTNLLGFIRKFAGYGRGAARFHEESTAAGWREVAAFHLQLPILMMPEVARRGVRRGAGLVGLLALWEVANLAGFVAERLDPRSRDPAALNGHRSGSAA